MLAKVAGFLAVAAMLAGAVPGFGQAGTGCIAGRNCEKFQTAAARPDGSIVRYLTGPVKDGRSPGLFAAIIDRNGIRSIAAAGVRRQGSREKITVDDLVHIGSNAKAMTSVMLAQLVAEGVFRNGWQTSIGEVFPELVGRIRTRYESVSLDRLLRMRGGIARNATDWWVHRNAEIKKRRYRILKMNLQKRPRIAPGRFVYSNLSYMVAAAMAERLTGKSWEELMIGRVFAPLGMRTAGFGWPGTWRKVDQPWGHRRAPFGAWQSKQIDNAAALGPAGTVHLSIADYAKFLKLWFRKVEPRILGRKNIEYLATPHSGSYAAGWTVRPKGAHSGDLLTHSGGNTYWRTTVRIEPDLGKAYFAGANSSDKGTHGMLDAIIQKLVRHGR